MRGSQPLNQDVRSPKVASQTNGLFDQPIVPEFTHRYEIIFDPKDSLQHFDWGCVA